VSGTYRFLLVASSNPSSFYKMATEEEVWWVDSFSVHAACETKGRRRCCSVALPISYSLTLRTKPLC